MRRKEKEITERHIIDNVINNALVCRLGLCKENIPYVVPVSFGYDGHYIFFHTAKEGMKLDFIAANNNVCFQFEHDVNIITNQTKACSWSFSYYSVIGFGKIIEITSVEDKIAALNCIMIHYSGREWEIGPASAEGTRVWRILIEQITGKQSKDKTIS